jgi:hypothetical protein
MVPGPAFVQPREIAHDAIRIMRMMASPLRHADCRERNNTLGGCRLGATAAASIVRDVDSQRAELEMEQMAAA